MCKSGNPAQVTNSNQSASSLGGSMQTSSSTLGPIPETLALYQALLGQAQNVASQPFDTNTLTEYAPWTDALNQAVNYQWGLGQQGMKFVPEAAGMIGLGGQSTINQIPGVAADLLSPWAGQAVDYGLSQGQAVGDWATGQAQNIMSQGPQLTPFSEEAVMQYYSPYQQNVIDATQDWFNNQNAIQGNQLIGQGIRTGNVFGGDRAGVAQGVLAGQQQLAQAPVIAGLYNQGYAQALAEFNQQNQLAAQLQQFGANLGLQGLQTQGQLGLGGLGMGLNAAGQANAQAIGALGQNQQAALQAGAMFGNLGATQFGQNLAGGQAAIGAGGIYPQYLQGLYNLSAQNQQQLQAYPFQTTSWYGGLLGGLGPLTGSQQAALSNLLTQQQVNQIGTQTTTPPQANQWIQAAGLGLAGLGLFLKDGGSVPRLARGGLADDDEDEHKQRLLQLAGDVVPLPMGYEDLARLRRNMILERRQYGIGTPQFNDLSRKIDQIEPKLFPNPEKRYQRGGGTSDFPYGEKNPPYGRRGYVPGESSVRLGHLVAPTLLQQIKEMNFNNLMRNLFSGSGGSGGRSSGSGNTSTLGGLTSLISSPTTKSVVGSLLGKGDSGSTGSGSGDEAAEVLRRGGLVNRYQDGGFEDDEEPPYEPEGFSTPDEESDPIELGGVAEGLRGGIGSDYAASGGDEDVEGVFGGEAAPIGLTPAGAPSVSAGFAAGQMGAEPGRWLQPIPGMGQRRRPGMGDLLTNIGLGLMARPGYGSHLDLSGVAAGMANFRQQRLQDEALDRKHTVDNSGETQRVRFADGRIWDTGMPTARALQLAQRKEERREDLDLRREALDVRRQALEGKALEADDRMSDDDAKDLALRFFDSGNRMEIAALGHGKIGTYNRQLVQKFVNQAIRDRAETTGTSVEQQRAEFSQRQAEWYGRTAGQRALGTMEARMGTAAEEARGAIDLARGAIEKVPRSDFLPLNRLIEGYSNQTLNPNQRQLFAYTQGVINTYAAVMNRGASITTDASRHRAEELLRTADNPEAYNATLDAIAREIDRARLAPAQMRELYRGLYGANSLGKPAGFEPLEPKKGSEPKAAPAGPSKGEIRRYKGKNYEFQGGENIESNWKEVL